MTEIEAKRALQTLLVNDGTHRRGVFVREVHVKMCDGEINAAILLSQIAYWFSPDEQGRTKTTIARDGHSWIAKRRHEWEEECYLTPARARNAEDFLVGKNLIVRCVWKFGGTPTTHLRINSPVYMELYQKSLAPCADFPDTDDDSRLAPTHKSSCVHTQSDLRPHTNPHTETTSENTNIDYQPTNQSVVDTQKQTINGKPMLDSYNSEQGPAVPVYYGADGKVYRCRGGEEPIGTARIADKPSAGSGAVVGGLDSSMGGGEDPFYDGQVVEDDGDYDIGPGPFFDRGWRDGVAGIPMASDTAFEDAEALVDYAEGYAAGEKRAKARQAAPAREVKVLCVAPPLSTPQLASHYDRADIDAGAQTQNRPEAQHNRFISGVVAAHVGAETATPPTPAVEWSAQTVKYGDTLESSSNEVLWNGCLHYLKSEDMMYLQKEKLKAKSSPLGYVRNAMIRLLMLEFETRTNPKAANQPTTAPRPTDGPASHRLLVNDDPERERKLAEMEALAGLGPVPEHMKIRRKKKGGE